MFYVTFYLLFVNHPRVACSCVIHQSYQSDNDRIEFVVCSIYFHSVLCIKLKTGDFSFCLDHIRFEKIGFLSLMGIVADATGSVV